MTSLTFPYSVVPFIVTLPPVVQPGVPEIVARKYGSIPVGFVTVENVKEFEFPEIATVAGNLTSAAAMYFETLVFVLSNKVFVLAALN